MSGYLIQLAPDRESLDGPSGTTQDLTDLHAWAEVYIPGAGWVGLDATSGLLTGEGHIPLSATPHPSSAAPITGATDPCVATMDFSNIVRRVHEGPRVTLPYSPSQWEQIDGFGHFVDAKLAEHDVRLTMGGEPTFVSVDDFVAPEWTIDADGPDKRARSGILADRLRAIFSPRGLVQRSQGKWYPGEPLPRWQITLLWRTDGHPLWSRQDLLADPWAGLRPDTPAPHRHRPEASRRLAEVLVIRVAADPGASGLRRRPAKASADWRLRRGRIVLSTGDSPAGLRLPLDSIAWDEAPPEPDADPSAAVTALQYSGIASPKQAVVVSAPDAPTTAVVIEQRGEYVFVFLPPLIHFDDFVELVGVLEQAASVTDTPIVVEGYGPPNDPQLQSLSVTPDPGVIKVNVQPTSSWAEQSDLTTTLYEQARQSRLGTETFAADGARPR